MMLADLQLPKLAIPRHVKENARKPVIEVSASSAPAGSVWISCCYATPHVDKGWPTKLFLTLSVLSRHVAGDALTEHPQQPVPVGRLFVIDPLVTHWLVDEAAWERKAARSWVGLQWEVEREDAAQKARELVAQFGGVWVPSNDDRYKRWRRP